MKTRLSLAIFAVAALGSAQVVQVVRTYKVGDVEAYHIEMKMEGGMEMEMAMDTSQKVTMVYENGDADVETTVSNGKMKMMGMDRGIPTGAPQKMRITKYGTPVTAEAKSRGMNMDYTKYMRGLPKSGMTVGQTITFDEVDPANEKMHVKGTTKLESVAAGIAKFVTNLDVWSEKSSKPMHLDFTSSIETVSGRAKRIDGKITNLAGAGGVPAGMPITGMTITMEAKA